MKKLSLVVLVAFATTLAPALSAQEAQQQVKHLVYPADEATPYGTYAELSASWWQWCYSMTPAAHPLTDSADVSAGQTGDVWFLGGSWAPSFVSDITMLAQANRNVVIPSGKALFLPISNASATGWELQNYFDPPLEVNQENLTAVATGWMEPTKVMQCKIDGRAVGNLDSYRVVSDVFEIQLPEGNFLGAEPGPTPAVSDGVYLLIPPLAPGEHTISFFAYVDNKVQKQGYNFNFIQDISYTITVADAE
jgi:hypothetical protein